jgi:membrane-associated phospholipid phosphatase
MSSVVGRWYVEFPLIVAGYLVFGLVRAALDPGAPGATNTAEFVQRLEQALTIDVEYSLNHAMLGHPVAIYLTGYFYRLCVLAVPAILVWLYVSRRDRYGELRTVLVVMTLLDLLFVWLVPESPPRLAQAGIVDHMADADILGAAASRTPSQTLNISGAMPSMHVAWTTWCAFAVFSVLRQRYPRAAWLVWLFPALVAFVVLVTGHHYVLDVVAGVALFAVVASSVRRWATR